MSIDKVTPQEWDSVRQIEKANHDPVNRPSHYNQGKFECIEYIKQQLGKEFPSYLEGSAIKYIHRHKDKNSNIQDLNKAKWNIDKLIEHYENRSIVSYQISNNQRPGNSGSLSTLCCMKRPRA